MRAKTLNEIGLWLNAGAAGILLGQMLVALAVTWLSVIAFAVLGCTFVLRKHFTLWEVEES